MPAPFPHEFSDTRYRKALKGLFKAGTGVTPPKLAGRDTETTIACDALLNPLQDNSAPARDLVIYGPRGNGKTVLLADFKRRAAEAGISALMLTPDDIDSPAALIRTLLLAAPTLPDATAAGPSTLMARLQNALRRSGLSLERVTLDGPGISAALSAVSDEELAVHALAWLTARCRTQPLLVTVDEAHTLDVGIGRRLLNISQKLRATGAPFVLILAGTPNLEAHLGEMSATFWDHSEVQPIGRLDPEATAQALTQPLAGWSVTFDPAALESVVADSQCYPYFIQLWGEALCEALVDDAQGYTVTPAIVKQGYAPVEARRQRYYGKRYLELEARGLLEAGALVAGVFEGTEQAHKAALRTTLCAGLGLEEAAATAALEQLAALGYTWQTTTATDWFEPGIPSLMTHVQTRLHDTLAQTEAPRP